MKSQVVYQQRVSTRSACQANEQCRKLGTCTQCHVAAQPQQSSIVVTTMSHLLKVPMM